MMRALVMAGGGLKVGFQAGVLQVWLDEAGVTFDHADGASGGCFNLAMYCEGRSGTQIADAWRNIEPLAGVGFDMLDLLGGEALMSMDRFRENVLREGWRLDWDAIRRSPRLGTFNLCNFTRQRLEVVEQSGMDEDRLVSAVALPMWFPPVKIEGDDYIDAVYLTDGNLEEAIRRGADEIWAIWTVSRAGKWRDVFVEHPEHKTGATGWVDTDSLGSKRPVQSGAFQLFVDDDNPETKRMLYRLWFLDDQGAEFTLSGEKIIHDDPGFDLWEDTTTLFVRIFEGHVAGAEEDGARIWGAGVLHIHTIDFLRQLSTMRATGPNLAAQAKAMARFGRLFLGKLWDTYGNRCLPFGLT